MAIPYIGCGLAGGEEKDFYLTMHLVEDFFEGTNADDFELVVIKY
jgi:hypothetical protein